MARTLLSLAVGATLLSATYAQVNHNNSLTPDAYWHNRYHALLSMASYGDYNLWCPNETFTQEAMLRNFPDSTRPPWNVVSTFGPTAHGAQGFTAIVPEMNKALIIFTGNYTLEQDLPTAVVGLDVLDENLLGVCNYFGKLNGFAGQNCTVNEFALQGYMEAKAETNNWEAIVSQYNGAGLVFSIAGHGLGGMHSIIASLDLNHQNICYYSHAYGAPRTLNGPSAWYYNYNFWGESGERGIANDDTYTESIPASLDYAHAGTPFKYSGWNNTALGPNWDICWEPEDPTCAPAPTGNSTAAQDHYFYFANVGDCGGNPKQDTAVINNFIFQQEMIEQTYNANIAQASSASVAAVAAASQAAMAQAQAASQAAAQAAANSASFVAQTAAAQATSSKSSGSNLAASLMAIGLAAGFVTLAL